MKGVKVSGRSNCCCCNLSVSFSAQLITLLCAQLITLAQSMSLTSAVKAAMWSQGWPRAKDYQQSFLICQNQTKLHPPALQRIDRLFNWEVGQTIWLIPSSHMCTKNGPMATHCNGFGEDGLLATGTSHCCHTPVRESGGGGAQWAADFTLDTLISGKISTFQDALPVCWIVVTLG